MTKSGISGTFTLECAISPCEVRNRRCRIASARTIGANKQTRASFTTIAAETALEFHTEAVAIT